MRIKTDIVFNAKFCIENGRLLFKSEEPSPLGSPAGNAERISRTCCNTLVKTSVVMFFFSKKKK